MFVLCKPSGNAVGFVAQPVEFKKLRLQARVKVHVVVVHHHQLPIGGEAPLHRPMPLSFVRQSDDTVEVHVARCQLSRSVVQEQTRDDCSPVRLNIQVAVDRHTRSAHGI